MMRYDRGKRRKQRAALALALTLLLSNGSIETVFAAPQIHDGWQYGVQMETAETDVSQGGNPDDTVTDGEPDESRDDGEADEGTEPDESQDGAEADGGTEPDESQDDGEADEGTEPDESQGSTDAKGALSEEEIAAQKAMEPAQFPVMDVLEVPEHYDASENSYGASFFAEDSAFDTRKDGNLPPVRDQNPWGTCWAFTTLSVMEASLAVQGLADPASVDLAERHLAYFTYHTGHDVLGNAEGDTVELINGENYLEKGGNMSQAAQRLMNWQGAAAESAYPYPGVKVMPEDLALERAQDDCFHMRNYFYVDTKANDSESIQNIKALVREYGCAGWSYFHDNSCYDYDTKAYYNNTKEKTNHAITIVGWDDDFPKENFKVQPQNNGAWIVRNSWGAAWGEDGYFYISYEDTSLGSGNPAGVMTAEPADQYDNNYFNSNTLAWDWQAGIKMAQTFTINGLLTQKEMLRAVSFMTGSTNKDFEIQIYKLTGMENGVVKDPESGTPMLAQPLTGRTAYAGVYTVDLPEPVECNAGEVISIVIHFLDETYGYVYKDNSKDGNNIKNHNVTHAGESFYYKTASGGWVDMHEQGESLRINLLTDNMGAELPFTVQVYTASPEKAEEDYRVDLSWNRLKNVSAYEIYRADTLDGAYEKIGVTDTLTLQYGDRIKQNDYAVHFYYKVRAVFADGSDTFSEPAEAALEEKLFFGALTLSYEEDQVKLRWDVVSGASGYEIQKKEKREADFVPLATIKDPSVTEYADDLSTAGLGIYQYRIRAYKEPEKYTDWKEDEIGKDLEMTQIDYRHLKFTCIPVEHAAYCSVSVRGSDFNHVSEDLPLRDTSLVYDVSGLLGPGGCRVGAFYSYCLVIKDNDGSELYRTSEVSFQMMPDALRIESVEIVEDDFVQDDLAGNTGTMAVKLTWSGGGGADEIVVYRSDNPNRWGEGYTTVSSELSSYMDVEIERGRFYYYRLCSVLRDASGGTLVEEMTEYREILVPGASGEVVGYIVTPLPGEQIKPEKQTPDTLLTAKVAGADAKTKIRFSVATRQAREILTASYNEEEGLWSAVLLDTLLSGFGEGAGTVTLLADGKRLAVVDVRFSQKNGDAGDNGEGEGGGTGDNGEGEGGDAGDNGEGEGGGTGDNDQGDDDWKEWFREGIYIKDIPEHVYTGKALKPTVAVYDDGSLLTGKKDYTVTYKSNVNAGMAKAIIKGKGNYAETVEKNFVIRPRPMEQVSVTVPAYLLFNNKDQKINVVVKDGAKKLSSKKDYTQTITYQKAVVTKARAVGIYEITVAGRGNYEGSVTLSCEVVEDKELLSKAVLKLPTASLPYRDGNAVTFDESLISVKLGKKLVPAREADGTVNYTISYQNNNFPGTAQVKVTAEPGSRYVGSCSRAFQVQGTSFSAKNIDIQGMESKVVYTGEPVMLTLALTDQVTGERLEEQTDYEIAYQNNENAGKAEVILTGLGKYSGTIRKKFTIAKAPLSEDMLGAKAVTAQQNRAGATPDIVLMYRGKKLSPRIDYTLSYKNNKNITTATKKAYITVSGKGNFTGSLRNAVELQIQPKSWQSGEITIEVPDMKYNRNQKEYKPVPVVCDNGRKLVKNKDYTVSYEQNCQNDIGSMPDTGHRARAIITALSADYAEGTADDIRIVEFRIMEKMISSAKVELVDPQYFSRYGVKPGQEDLRVTYGTEPVGDLEYEILSYSRNDRKGKAVLVIGGKGKYGGTKKTTFLIRAKGMRTNQADSILRAIAVLKESLLRLSP